MPFADLALSRRLEAAEGDACRQFAAARRRLQPSCGAEWMECGGGIAVFDGVDSPVTQAFGLGVFEPLTPEVLDAVEAFFFDRGAAAQLEVSPHAGVPATALLCERGYRPIELASVLFQDVQTEVRPLPPGITVRVTGPEEVDVWSDVSARGWCHEMPEMREFLKEMGSVTAAREDIVCVLGELGGVPGAASALCLNDGVALFAGASTVPELRRRGLQGAVLQERMRLAAERGCDIAMMAAAVGSESQRNAERKGFRIAYTRTKWSLARS
ncbi:MAG: hypothetical protein SGI92_26765 [Bryobacteraceae bacterium]|nr:hypothetical protein [Bryobacteraceae bacterium]